MKVSMLCVGCSQQGEANKLSTELTDSIFYEFKCDKGHENVTVLRSHRFELLFQMGLYAFSDGYYREAVSNFAAAIERFHEFCISVLAHNHDGDLQIDKSVFHLAETPYDAEYTKSWKLLSKQSERQLGAYIMLYLISFKRSPEMLSDKWITYRNDVTHKGIFSTKDKANKYAEVVFNYIKDKLVELKSAFPEATQKVYMQEMEKFTDTQSDVFNGKTLVKYTPATCFHVGKNIEDIQELDYEKSMKQAQEYASSKLYV